MKSFEEKPLNGELVVRRNKSTVNCQVVLTRKRRRMREQGQQKTNKRRRGGAKRRKQIRSLTCVSKAGGSHKALADGHRHPSDMSACRHEAGREGWIGSMYVDERAMLRWLSSTARCHMHRDRGHAASSDTSIANRRIVARQRYRSAKHVMQANASGIHTPAGQASWRKAGPSCGLRLAD